MPFEIHRLLKEARNKRTAILSGLVFLKLNVIRFVNPDQNVLYKMTVKIAEGKMTQSQLKKFIMENVILDFETINAYNESEN